MKLPHWCRPPTPLELAARELIAAERGKLEAESAKEYAEALVTYNAARIRRLKGYINLTTATAAVD